MIVIPGMELRDRACVQSTENTSAPDQPPLDTPLELAHAWARAGFRRMHLSDLDATRGRAENASVVRDLLADVPLGIQVAGGIESEDMVERLFDEGAAWAVLGSRALEDAEWLATSAMMFPGRLIVAADVRERHIVTRGRARPGTRDVLDVVDELNELPLGGILVSAIHREGDLAGTDLLLMEDLVEHSANPVIASGGITSIGDLRELAERGIAAAVIGAALHSGALDARAVAEEFAS